MSSTDNSVVANDSCGDPEEGDCREQRPTLATQLSLATTPCNLRIAVAGALLVSMLAGTISGCRSLEDMRADTRVGETDERLEAYEEISVALRDLSAADPEDRITLQQMSEFLRQQYQSELGASPLLRARILDLALQSQLSCRQELLEQALSQDKDVMVLITALVAVHEAPPANARQLLTQALTHKELLVRVEAAKAFGRVGQADWVPTLVQLILLDRGDDSVEYQAHRSACTLLGEERPFTIADWKSWLDQQPAS